MESSFLMAGIAMRCVSDDPRVFQCLAKFLFQREDSNDHHPVITITVVHSVLTSSIQGRIIGRNREGTVFVLSETALLVRFPNGDTSLVNWADNTVTITIVGPGMPNWRRFLLKYLLDSISIVLRKLGILGMHAGVICYRGKSVLLLGTSGSGKTTTAMAAVRGGLRSLSDDTTFVTVAGGTIQAWPIQTGLGLTEDLRRMLPLKIPVHTEYVDGDKTYIMHDAAHDTGPVVLNAILFTELRDDISEVVPCLEAESFRHILRCLGHILTPYYETDIDIYSTMAKTIPAFRLWIGRDHEYLPKLLKDTLRTI